MKLSRFYIIALSAFIVSPLITYAQTSKRPGDVIGWSTTKWGMTEKQLSRMFRDDLIDISADYSGREEWADSPVIPYYRIDGQSIGSGTYHTDFLLSRNDRKLHGVEIVSTTNSVEEQAVLFTELKERLLTKYGYSDDRDEWNQTMLELDIYYEHQVIWKFNSTMIIMRWREMKQGHEDQTEEDDLKIEYIDRKYFDQQSNDLDKL